MAYDKRINSYLSADAALHHRGTGEPMDTRVIANNTVLERLVSGDIAVKLHHTRVVTFHDYPDADDPDQGEYVTLNTGGWYTVTTKDRMNRYAPDNVAVNGPTDAYHHWEGYQTEGGPWEVAVLPEDESTESSYGGGQYYNTRSKPGTVVYHLSAKSDHKLTIDVRTGLKKGWE